ncbi:M1 family metallopeptidase [Epilithonimonas ginsengisoli]|uniref:M1 family metallopeptidase n=1 Tax=Epilithonimonas ginsengisoli TaxID=1245592 RepID=A0ABU4JF58_9FLAO|nr:MULTISPECIES: M1 family metallopeptidase [Chryseobacterium group]MBV6879572.1 M1 family metallopeptidase [Epilithonimonas sp. FP105]MDW8548208.1 M1 family metallopeptidase [Epilithonimonas ginsengisoli]OAH73429.1 peptidase M1 [Chryseobacterium sp. FP211-J200]
MKKLVLLSILISGVSQAQFFENAKTTRIDTLKGSNTEFRDFWDVKKYDIVLEPNFDTKSIKGSNKISLTIEKDVKNPTFQIDLQKPMKADKITASFPMTDKKVDGDFIFLSTKKNFKKGETYTIDIDYSGNPLIAKHAPWDGGWIFNKDKNGNPWMTVADEGIGASIWLPVKDIWSDEPNNGITFKIITPKDLVGVANGRLIKQENVGDKKSWTWEVKNPINDYSIIPSIGKYVNFKDTFDGEEGKLDLDYWVLDYNLDKAKKQFEQVQAMMKAFEHWFGPYPFYKDSYKLVESPHLGMEHQSNVAYGNKYQNGYLGRDLSGTGIGLKWDYIIIHETGHEWFANNITAKDQADMWIHESFTTYSETLFVDHLFGKADGNQYLQGIRKNIQNDKPIIGTYGVRNEGSGDMYPKGANMLHTIRQVINNDEKFRQILRGLNKDFYHQTVTTEQIEKYFSEKSGIDLSTIFTQYLRTIKIPTLEYKQTGNQLTYKWTNVIPDLKLPIRLADGQELKPTEQSQTVTLRSDKPVAFDKNYYIEVKQVQ